MQFRNAYGTYVEINLRYTTFIRYLRISKAVDAFVFRRTERQNVHFIRSSYNLKNPRIYTLQR